MSPQVTPSLRHLPKTFVCHLNEMKTFQHHQFAASWPAILFEEWGHIEALAEMFGGSRSKINPARKTNKQVFVSYNLQNTDSNFALLVENRIKEEMEAFPEKF
uniref:Proteasome assembly chaperone 4 n=1 Tax=Saimiri boliviensis boliviensis TaxID=39432 RepID=A0A2K6USX9_SAIBB